MPPVSDIFDVVDENDCVIGQKPRAEVHAQGLLHRASHIWIWNKRGELLLQMRSALKDRFPSTWTSSVSGHVDTGEDYLQAAMREIQEEAGITGKLKEIAYIRACKETEQEFVKLYRLEHEGPFIAPPDEVSEFRWVSPMLMNQMLVSAPQTFSPSLAYLWRHHGILH